MPPCDRPAYHGKHAQYLPTRSPANLRDVAAPDGGRPHGVAPTAFVRSAASSQRARGAAGGRPVAAHGRRLRMDYWYRPRQGRLHCLIIVLLGVSTAPIAAFAQLGPMSTIGKSAADSVSAQTLGLKLRADLRISAHRPLSAALPRLTQETSARKEPRLPPPPHSEAPRKEGPGLDRWAAGGEAQDNIPPSEPLLPSMPWQHRRVRWSVPLAVLAIRHSFARVRRSHHRVQRRRVRSCARPIVPSVPNWYARVP